VCFIVRFNGKEKNNMKIKPKILELFAGAGGFALGIDRAGFKTLGLIESDKDCVNTLRTNRPAWNVIHSGVEDVEYSEFKGVDIVSGGFPCQAFSSAGKRLGFVDKRGSLFFEMMRPIRELKPKMVIAENVQGLLSHNKGKTFETILSTLREEGYSVNYQLLNALDFGVPQKRKRLIIIAIHGHVSVPSIPIPNVPHKTIKDALKKCPKSEGASYSEIKRSVLDLVPPGGCWTSLPDKVQRSYMGASYGHESNMGGRRGIARRISWDEPSLTILCSPSQKQTERCHPDETRPFTTRESARIQTFPDDWVFSGALSSQYRQIGNAVPVIFAEYIARHVMSIYKNNFIGKSLPTCGMAI
jgi:DNA (cytosine-5)-methyltransferase 1